MFRLIHAEHSQAPTRPLVCCKSNRLLNFSNCFSFETYFGPLRSATSDPFVVLSSPLLSAFDAFELSGNRHVAAAAATDE